MKENNNYFKTVNLGVRAGYPLYLFFVKNKKKDAASILNAKAFSKQNFKKFINFT